MPKPSSRLQPQTTQPTNQNPPVLGWVAVLAIIAFVVWGLKLTNPEPKHDRQQDQQQVIDHGDHGDRQPKPDNTALKDCILIVVVDKKTVNENIDYTLTMQNDKFWKELAPTLVKKVEFLEDDDDLGKKAITAANLPAPVVLLLNSSTKKLVWSMPLPKGGTSEIERRLK